MKLPLPAHAVVFDMDGLLFDTEALYRTALFEAAAEGGHAMTEDVHRRMLGCPWPTIRIQLLEHYGSGFPVDDLRNAWLRHFNVLADSDLMLKQGVSELLDLLDALNLPRAIATSSFHHSVQHHLARHSLTERFHHIVAHGDYVASKPAPDPYLRASERLGIAPKHCLALEDSHNGVRSAAAAGMMTIMIPDLLLPTPEIAALCHLVLPDLHQVRPLLLTERSVG